MVPALDVLIIERPEQLKALGHPLRLRILQLLGESDDELTNRDIATRLDVDPGHLHFHVRMLLNAGLIEPGEGGTGREKPYRALAATIRVAPELLASGAAQDARAAMLEEVGRASAAPASEGTFRSAQMTVRLDPEQVRDAWKALVEYARRHEDPSREPLLLTLFAHPPAGGEPDASTRAGAAS